MQTTITNDYEALVLALTLGLTAPSDEQAEKVMCVAEPIATRLALEEVEEAKLAALKAADELRARPSRVAPTSWN